MKNDMKKILTLLAITLAALTSCKPDEQEIIPPEPEVYLDVYHDDIVFPSDGGEDTFEIDSNTDWTITNEADWLTIEPMKGNGYYNVTLTASASDLYDDRNTVITIKAGDKTEAFTVTQKYAEALLVTKNKFDIPQEGGEFSIEVQSNISYDIIIDDDCQSWITEVPQSKALTTYTHTYSVSENPNTENREGIITIIGDNGKEEVVNIFQAQIDELVLSETEFTVPGEGGEITVYMRANVDYEVLIPEEITWVEQLFSDMTDMLLFKIAPNSETSDRTAVIIVKDKNSDLSQSFTITQISKTKVNEDVTLQTEDDIVALCEAGYEIINGDLTISGNSIVTLSKLDNKIKEINGDLYINCPSLLSLDGLYSLNYIKGDLHLKRAGIEQFEGLNNLKEISGDFIIGETTHTQMADGSWLTSLKSFEGLDNLAIIGGTLSILYENYYWLTNVERCTNLKTFKGLKKLKEIGGLKIEEERRDVSASLLESFEGLESLEKINGDFIITSEYEEAFINLVSFKGLNNLKEITGEFKVTNVDGDLMSYEGLNSLETVGTFNAIDGITTFTGLSSLKNISKDFIMDTYPAIESLEGLSSLEYVGGNFTPKGSFNSLKGLENLSRVDGDFVISRATRNIPNLSSLEGLSSLSIINGDFEIIGMPEWQDLKPLSNLSTVLGTLHLTGYLHSLGGLGNLHTVGNLNISQLDITSFNGINIRNVTNIEISYCSQLSDLSALSKSIQSNVNDIMIQNCESLYDFSPFVPIVETMTGNWVVNGCGYNPTKYQMLNGESKPQE